MVFDKNSLFFMGILVRINLSYIYIFGFRNEFFVVDRGYFIILVKFSFEVLGFLGVRFEGFMVGLGVFLCVVFLYFVLVIDEFSKWDVYLFV